MDLVVVSYVSFFSLSKGIVNILSGDGAGSFSTWSLINGSTTGDPGSVFPLSPVVGDFDGDGKLDVIEINGFSINILPGNGDGTVEGPIVFAQDSNPFALATGDFNGDGKLDVAEVSLIGNNGSVVLNMSGP